MVTRDRRLAPNDEVVASVMDGEAIIINLSTGMYYSMDQAGGFLWETLSGGHSLDETAALLAQRYEVTASQAQADVERLAAELLEENLVIVADRAAPNGASSSPPSEPRLPYASPQLSQAPAAAMEDQASNGQPKRPYEAPQLNKYTDMGDLVAFDPPWPGLHEFPWEAQSREASR